MLCKYFTVAALSVIGVAAFPNARELKNLQSLKDTAMPTINVPAESTLTLTAYEWNTVSNEFIQ